LSRACANRSRRPSARRRESVAAEPHSATPGSTPSWFGFPITIRPEAAINRVDLLQWLEQHRVATRLLFAGNLVRQPYTQGRTFRVPAPLVHTDRIMNDTFWIGVWPGLTTEMLDYAADQIRLFLGRDFD